MTFIGFVLALILPLAGHYVARYISKNVIAGAKIYFWLLAAVVLLYVLVVERRSLSSIGFHMPGIGDIGAAVLVAIVSVVGIGLIFNFVFPALHAETLTGGASAVLFTAPFWARFWVVTRAAFTEEILFRGYGTERLGKWAGSFWFAGLVTWAIFTYAHLAAWGWAELLAAGWAGALITLLYLWRRNLWANILCHWLIDGAGFLLMPAMQHH